VGDSGRLARPVSTTVTPSLQAPGRSGLRDCNLLGRATDTVTFSMAHDRLNGRPGDAIATPTGSQTNARVFS